MLEGIIDLIKDQALGAITNESGVSADQKDAVLETTTSAVMDGLKNHFTPDNLSSIMNLFGGGSAGSNNVVSSIQNSVVSALSEKVGLNQDVANGIASNVVPALIGMLSQKSDDPNDSFSFESLVESFTGKDGGGILGTLGKLFG